MLGSDQSRTETSAVLGTGVSVGGVGVTGPWPVPGAWISAGRCTYEKLLVRPTGRSSAAARPAPSVLARKASSAAWASAGKPAALSATGVVVATGVASGAGVPDWAAGAAPATAPPR